MPTVSSGGYTVEIVAGRHAVGLSKLFSGDPQGSLALFDQAIAIFDPAEDRRTTRYGGEYWSSALAGRAAALWMLGKPDAARADAAASLQSARAFGHAMTLGNNLVFAAWIQFACGQHGDRRRACGENLKALADEKGEPFYRAFSLMVEGLVAIADGGAEARGRANLGCARARSKRRSAATRSRGGIPCDRSDPSEPAGARLSR